MPQVILTLQKQVADLTALVQGLQAQNAALQVENKLLRQKNQLLLKRLFGRKSEQLDPRQLQLLLGELEQREAPVAIPPPDDPPPTRPRDKRGRSSLLTLFGTGDRHHPGEVDPILWTKNS